MNAMKLRLLMMGVILAVVGGALIAGRGFSYTYVGLSGFGIALFLAGALLLK